MMENQKIIIGCDLVFLPSFRKVLERTPTIKKHLFLPREEKNATWETLAGIFAAKEAIVKALGKFLKLKRFNFRQIEIIRDKKEGPKIKIHLNDKKMRKILDFDLSISHNGDYALAVAIFLVQK
jgi:phosphopantetheine--protein transferase-like protein